MTYTSQENAALKFREIEVALMSGEIISSIIKLVREYGEKCKESQAKYTYKKDVEIQLERALADIKNLEGHKKNQQDREDQILKILGCVCDEY